MLGLLGDRRRREDERTVVERAKAGKTVNEL